MSIKKHFNTFHFKFFKLVFTSRSITSFTSRIINYTYLVLKIRFLNLYKSFQEIASNKEIISNITKMYLTL